MGAANVSERGLISSMLVGMKKQDAQNRLLEAGWCMRVTREDGVNYLGTCDYRNNRFDVEVEHGIIVKVQ